MRVSVRRRVTIARVSLLPVVDFLFIIVLFVGIGAHVPQCWDTMDRPDGLILPYARSSVVGVSPQPPRLVVYVVADGTVFIGGAPRNGKWVFDCLAVEARISRDMETKLSDREVFIKADERVEWRHVQKILDWCRQDEIAIQRIVFGARPPEERW